MTSCRHTAPLLSVLRYGEIDDRSDRHVAHLEFCGTCQVALIDDGALTRQLERALRERIEGAVPSPGAWLALKRRISIEPVRWQTRLSRWLRVPAGGLASAGALATLAIGLTVSVRPPAPDATGEIASREDASRTMLPIRTTPFAETARVPAEAFDAPTRPDVESALMEVRYEHPVKDPASYVALASVLGEKASPSGADDLPDGYELVAYDPGTGAE